MSFNWDIDKIRRAKEMSLVSIMTCLVVLSILTGLGFLPIYVSLSFVNGFLVPFIVFNLYLNNKQRSK